jgi:DNA-directed RNA polymerase subunit beta'
MSEIDGVISFGDDIRGKRRVYVTPDVGEQVEYQISKSKQFLVAEGDRVRAGEQLTAGQPDPHDILAVLGLYELTRYLVDEAQEVYRLQGVRINDKHIEVIVRQMLSKVRVVDSGDTHFLQQDVVDRHVFRDENKRVLGDGGEPATFEPVLLGITKASLSTESFISAASFQETTKVLTEASLSAKTDNLRGLKESVIMGRLIPAGTGFVSKETGRAEVKVDGVEDKSARDTVVVVPGSVGSDSGATTEIRPAASFVPGAPTRP